MSIKFVSAGNILDDPADLLVCCVNLVPGVMGAGQAKAFADRWPGLPELHRLMARMKCLEIGKGCIVDSGGERPWRSIFLLPTKCDWRDPSKLSWVEGGLRSLVDRVQDANETEMNYRSIACPAAGCGLGGLPWGQVRPLIEGAAARLPEVEWTVYEPGAERRAVR